ncbi:MAG: DUF4349 domain-containing protein [Chloroflexota bacterium]
MKTKKIGLIVFIIVALLLAGCASAAPTRSAAQKMGEEAKPVSAPGEVEAQLAAATPAPAVNADMLAASLPVSDRMIIKNAVLDLLVQNTDRAIDQVTQLAADQGGYLLSTRSWYDGEFKIAELKLGVPSTAFESTLNYLRRIGTQVLNETTSGQDVSAEYTDLKSRLTNLEATAARVRQFLDEAKTVEEALKINQTLSDLEAQIEQTKGQMRFYEGRAAYSTITVTLSPQMPTPTPTPTPTPQPGWNPGRTAGDASEIMVKMLQGLIDALIWLVMLGWPFLLGAAVLWWLARRFGRKPARPTVEKNE